MHYQKKNTSENPNLIPHLTYHFFIILLEQGTKVVGATLALQSVYKKGPGGCRSTHQSIPPPFTPSI